jgi:hypothetical protein
VEKSLKPFSLREGMARAFDQSSFSQNQQGGRFADIARQ